MTNLSFKHLIEADQITKEDISKLISLADRYRQQNPRETIKEGAGYGYILATLFFEASTRTRFSFEAAMLRLGGQVLTLEQGESSSIKKGESLSDMGRIMSGYVDLIAARHPKIGGITEFAKNATVPVINAGDGANQHPTQSLVDIYTIACEKKRLDNLEIGILGDLRYGRSVHSLMSIISKYSNNNFTLISHPSLTIDPKKKKEFEEMGCKITESSDLEGSIKNLDVLYASRIQAERFKDQGEYEEIKNNYHHITKETLKDVKEGMIVMHALPRINEIDEEVDDMPCAKYFEQAEYGLYIRMALLALMIDAA